MILRGFLIPAIGLNSLKSLLGIETINDMGTFTQARFCLNSLKSLLGIETLSLVRRMMRDKFKLAKIPIRD